MTPVLPYWRLSGFYFLFFFVIGGILPFWPLYLQSLGFDVIQIGTLMTVLVMTKFFSAYLWGWLIDYTRMRIRLIRFASLMSAVSFVAVLFAKHYTALAAALFLFSCFWGASLPQIEAMTLSYLARSTNNYALLRLWGSIGFIVATILLFWLFANATIDLLPFILLIPIVALWLLTLSIPEHYTAPGKRQKGALLSVIKKPDVFALLSACFLMQASHGAYNTFFTILLKSNAYADQMIGMLWVVAVAAEIVIFIIMHHLIRRFGLKKMLLISLFMAIVRWLTVGYFTAFLPAVFFAQLLHAFTFGAYHATAIQYIHREFKYPIQGRGQALYDAVSFGGGLALGSLVSGYLWDAFAAQGVFLFAAVLAFIAYVIVYLRIK